MKKSLSLLLSLVMLLSCLCVSGTSAYAYKLAEVPEVKLGDTFAVSVPVTDLNSETNDENADCYFAKFIPEYNGYYEFAFDTNFTGGDEEALMVGIVSRNDEDMVNLTICMNVTGDMAEVARMLGVSDSPNTAGELIAGKEYELMILNGTKGEFNANVTLRNHTHYFKTFTEKAHVDSDDMDFNTDGEKYTGCTVSNCQYHKTINTYYSVKSVKLSKTKYTYDGKAKKPAVTVKDRKGNVLKKDRDYTLSYSKNKGVGTAKVTVKFKGNYEGSTSKTFKINPKGTSLTKLTAKKKGFTAKWKKQTSKTTGYQIQYSTSKKFTKKTTKTATVSKNKTLTKTVKKLKGSKKYYVRIRTFKTVDGKKYYSGWSKVKTVKTRK